MVRMILAVCVATISLNAHAHDDRRIHERDRTGAEFVLADDATALCPILIGDNASAATKAAADRLVGILSQMTGAAFAIESSDGSRQGIVFGVPSEFSKLRYEIGFDATDPREMQGYLIEVKDDSLYLLAATTMGIDYVATALLYELGYRVYAPTPRWTIIPKVSRAVFQGRIREAPDFYFRRVWPSWGWWNAAHGEAFEEWRRANRDGGFNVDASHVYQEMPAWYPDAFSKHPEYWALVDGKRGPSAEPKFCISNAGLRKLIADDAVNYFRKHPDRVGLSREPSDGGGWCGCEACKALGSPSDLAVLLANESAQAVRAAGIEGKKIGILAYNYHSPPPQVSVDDDVVVHVANGFIKGGFAFDELVAKWAAKCSDTQLGTYEYYSVYLWSHDLPGRPRAAQIDWLMRTIPERYHQNIRYYTAESADNWAAVGLGHFLAEQALWNIDSVSRADELEAQYIAECFGPAAAPMADFYRFINHTKPILAEHVLAKLYRILADAREAAKDDPAVMGRLADLAAYAVYCEHVLRQSQSPSLENKLALRRFAAGIVERRMIQTLAIRYSGVELGVPKADDIDWESRVEIDDDVLWAAVGRGVGEFKPLGFEPRAFSDDLVPVRSFAKARVAGSFIHDDFNWHRFYTWAKSDQKRFDFQVTGGLVPHYRDRGNVELRLVQIGGASETGAKETVVASDSSVPPDGQPRKVVFKIPERGLYRLDMTNNGDISRLTWDSSQPITLHTSLDDVPGFHLNGNSQPFFFYVPRDTEVLGMYVNSQSGKILTMNDEVIFELSAETRGKFIGVDLPASRRGQLYKLIGVYGNFVLLTVPPYVSPSPNGLLLPKEVVEAELTR